MQVHAQVDSLVDAVLDRLGRRIVLGLPLGLGKANHIANALYDRAAQDPSIHLRILTALSLDPPQPSGNLEQRFLSPINARLFGGYPRLRYVQALRAGMLPANVEVSEFFLTAGQWLGVAPMQQQFICANYTHATRYLLDQGVNLVAQLVARKPSGELSLSCNPELTLELLGPMRERSRAGIPCMLVGQVNDALPFMLGDPVLAPERMDHLLDDDSTRFPLFTPPRRPVDPSAHAIGLRIAALVPDGGTLQIGIGGIADAVCHGLILRHTHNDAFRLLHEQLSPGPSAAPPRPQGDDAHPITDAQRRTGDAPELGAFEQGLYGLSEMFVDGFLHLYRHGVLKRSAGDGALLHAGFFLASNGLHETLREMPDHERARFQMKPISFVNELYDSDTASEQTKRHDRQGARFINSAMMVTALGGVVSDTLEDAQVVSGVGGQYNFVAQAFALRDARSIIALNATRQHEGRCVSNIRWAHSSETIPRHLRDIVVTEYGVADLRGRSDRDCIAAMLTITDSRHQRALLSRAKRAGKIERDYRIPDAYRRNHPHRLESALSVSIRKGLLPAYPFGTNLEPVEQTLLPALERLAQSGTSQRLRMLCTGAARARASARIHRPALERMGLWRPRGWTDRARRWLVLAALEDCRHDDPTGTRRDDALQSS